METQKYVDSTGATYIYDPERDWIEIWSPTDGNAPSKIMPPLHPGFYLAWDRAGFTRPEPSRWTQIKSFLTGHIGWRALLR